MFVLTFLPTLAGFWQTLKGLFSAVSTPILQVNTSTRLKLLTKSTRLSYACTAQTSKCQQIVYSSFRLLMFSEFLICPQNFAMCMLQLHDLKNQDFAIFDEIYV